MEVEGVRGCEGCFLAKGGGDKGMVAGEVDKVGDG